MSAMSRSRPRPTLKTNSLAPVRGNKGIEMAYRRKLKRLIAEMQASITYWLKAAYRANTPELAQDESPATALRKAMRKLSRRWQANFDQGATDLASWFAQETKDYADGSLQRILATSGFAVSFKMTRPMQDAYSAVIGENVGLIKSIAAEYLTQVEGLVMRSVQQGRDLSYLTEQLQKRFAITNRRAVLISRDQNNKATAVVERVRQSELGITHAVWQHSHAGQDPRPEHMKWDGKTYEIAKGMWSEVEHEWVWPGTPINCRCVSRPVLPALSGARVAPR